MSGGVGGGLDSESAALLAEIISDSQLVIGSLLVEVEDEQGESEEGSGLLERSNASGVDGEIDGMLLGGGKAVE